ncbi:MAG TPA: PadR family transcriptional regulator [Candidatus Intestinimonas pullistercoris]|uniref:PadR family transcriptional regulator n=1 Tax=Candidatus Intestinimonas pullistercoris TaxID=2838623 RepID=A0A9D2P0A3_9FIRM|nr:PadR family transcriptional regulator [Candidatus Intestinimonas pullistercoris]
MKADKNLLSGSTTLLVLSLLASGDKYGYEMIAELDARSDHTFTLKEGTLYPILHGLEKDGAVKSYTRETDSNRTRKYYHITRKGLRLLEEQKREWTEFSEKVNAILSALAPTEGEALAGPASS